MFKNHSKTKLFLFFMLGFFLCGAFCFKGYTKNLTPIEASQSQSIEIAPTANGSRVFIATNSLVVGKDGDLITTELELICQTSIHSDLNIKSLNELRAHHLIRHPTLLIPRYVPGTLATIASGSSDSYTHWLFDSLAKLQTLEESGLVYDKIYAGELTTYQRDMLLAFDIPESKIIDGGYWTQLYANKVLAPELPTKALKVSKASAIYLKEKLLPQNGPQTPNKLFILTQNSLDSFNQNKSLLKLLEKFSIQPLVIDPYSPLEQAWIFSKARVLIAYPDQTLANLIFMNKEALVIEWQEPGQDLLFFENLAKELQLNFYSIKSDENCLEKLLEDFRAQF